MICAGDNLATTDGDGHMHGSFRRDVQDRVIIEPHSINPVFCSGLASVRMLNSEIHFIGYVDQLDSAGEPERILNLRVIMPLASVKQALPLIASASMGGVVECMRNGAIYLATWAALVDIVLV